MSGRPSLPEQTDVCIIGGGVIGTSIAFFFASETNTDVTLLEKDAIASGSTGDSSAILRHHYGDQEIYSKMAWWSHDFYRNFQERTGEAIAHADNPLVRFGNEDTPEGEYINSGYQVLSSLGIPASRYEQNELPEKYPMLANLDRFDFAVSDDNAGYSDGADAANGFARAAANNDATIVTGVAAESIVIEDDHITAVKTTEGTVECDTLVVAAGPWTPRLGEFLGVEIPIKTTREQVVILDPSNEYTSKYPSLTPTTALPSGEWYIRPDFGDGILVATHHTDEEVNPDTYNNTPDEEMLLDLTDRLIDLIPELDDAGIQGQYCGVYSTTPDHDFILDQIGPDGCYFACGFSGHGFKHAPAVGKMMSEFITTGETTLVDISYFSYDRFESDPHGHGRSADDV